MVYVLVVLLAEVTEPRCRRGRHRSAHGAIPGACRGKRAEDVPTARAAGPATELQHDAAELPATGKLQSLLFVTLLCHLW